MSNEPVQPEPSNGARPSVAGDTIGGRAGADSSQNEPDAVRLKLEAMFELLRRPVDSGPQPPENRIDETSQARQRFRILRPHAKGGLGEVWVALDEELNRNVAFKEIQFRYAGHAESRTRFLREATVTGQLEHPGIVPVYAVGQQDDGRPFYAMRFIQGDSLQQAIDRFHQAHGLGTDPHQRQLELRKLLDRFIDVCNAIAYAHSRGIVHRDLKPENIMLGAFGETLVVDWGLAKSVGGTDENHVPQDRPAPSADAPAPTQLGATIGTPAYMSPEQAAGRTDQLGPLSDVYSLGATLYCLLAGRAPFADTDLQTVLAKVQRGEFPRPRQVNATMPPALDAVCLKAMALVPANRYPLPQALADDLEHWLADEAVSAHRDPLTDRVSRWGRRHRAIVTGALALMLTTIVALVANNELLKAEKGRTEARRLETVESRNLAEERFVAVLDTYGKLALEIELKLERRPETESLRLELLNTARDGLTRLMQTSNSVPISNYLLAWTYLRLGDLHSLAGDADLSHEAYIHARSAATAAVESDPNDLLARRSLGLAFGKLGLWHFTRGEFEKATQNYSQFHERAQRLALESGDYQFKRDLSVACQNLGDVHARDGNISLAKQFYERSLALDEEIGNTADLGVPNGYDSTVVETKLAATALKARQLDVAAPRVQKALRIALALVTGDPDNTELQHNLAVTYASAAELARRVGDIEAAAKYAGKRLGICQQLATADKQNVRSQVELAGAYQSIGEIMVKLGETRLADEYFRGALVVDAELAKRDPTNGEFRRNLAVSQIKVGEISEVTGDDVAARTFFSAALDGLRQQAEHKPARSEADADIAVCYNHLGGLAFKTGDFPLARKYFQASQVIRERRSEEDTANVQRRIDLGWIYSRLGNVELACGNPGRARELFEKDLQISEWAAESATKDADVQDGLANAHVHVAAAYLEEGNTRAARDSLQKALGILERLTKSSPHNIQWQTSLGEVLGSFADLEMRSKNLDSARVWLERAVTVLQKTAAEAEAVGRPLDRTLLESREAELEFSKVLLRALNEDVEFSLLQPARIVPKVLQIRAELLAQRGQHQTAAETVSILLSSRWKTDESAYNCAVILSLCAGAARDPKPDVDFEDDARPLSEHYALHAMELLRQAQADGYFADPDQIAELKRTSKLDAIRARPDFRAFVSQFREPKP